ncbi:hypothetical protein [Martelella soudanensis]|uniref:hypothetical protein n=1 Tax=unclassified Martelella TaxID=2629616 RepID=UPI0015E01E10|nr:MULTISPECIES: hypothetical protein [unclassified Martelella]
MLVALHMAVCTGAVDMSDEGRVLMGTQIRGGVVETRSRATVATVNTIVALPESWPDHTMLMAREYGCIRAICALKDD